MSELTTQEEEGDSTGAEKRGSSASRPSNPGEREETPWVKSQKREDPTGLEGNRRPLGMENCNFFRLGQRGDGLTKSGVREMLHDPEKGEEKGWPIPTAMGGKKLFPSASTKRFPKGERKKEPEVVGKRTPGSDPRSVPIGKRLH